MNTSAIAVGAVRGIERTESTDLAVCEFERVGQLLTDLGDADWPRPNGLPGLGRPRCRRPRSRYGTDILVPAAISLVHADRGPD